MAGAYSSHMLSKFEESTVPPPSICTSGLMSFDQSMHGINMFSTQQSMALGPSASQASNMSGMSAAAFSDYMFERVNRLQAKLNQKLGPEYISQRPGPGGGAKLTYAEGWKVINVANEVFGYEGWSSSIVNMTTDYMDYNEETRRYNVGVSVILRVTLKEGVSHEDVGYGMIENAKSKGMALDKVKKEAVTDALKRTLRTFGNVLGNCLYDKQYTAEVVKIKVPPIKFDKDALYRVPALVDQIPPPAAASSSVSTTVPPPQPPKGQVPPQAQRAAAPNPQLPRPVAAPSTTTERRVSFAPQQPAKPPPPPAVKKEEPVAVPIPAAPKPAGDDEYDNYGFSDDDALFSAVDLGDADLGRPIDFEEGLAGGSALEELEQAEAAAAAASVKAPAAVAVAPAEARYGPMGLGRTGAQPAQQQARSNMGPPALPANSNRPPTAHGQRPSPAGASSTSRPPTVNPAAASVPAPAPAPVAVRQRPPSAGGFHFPPGDAAEPES